jgi:phosphate transport system substrate-binding protein
VRGLAWRLAIYAVIVAGLLVWRVVPGLRGKLPEIPAFREVDRTLELSGTSLAPGLIAALADEYALRYPEIRIESRPGGTTHALEDLANGRADIAFLSRPVSDEELRVFLERGDSVTAYPVALGGIAVLVGEGSRIETLSVDDLRRLLGGGPRAEGDPEHLYVPDPNLGLWETLVAQLAIPAEPPASLRWMAGESEVVEAVSIDGEGIGLASTLALPEGLSGLGARPVPVRRSAAGAAFTASHDELAAGEYPLFHYVYAACGRAPGAAAAGFVTFLFSGRGQRLVSRLGYLPARDVPRLVQLVSRPIGEGT